MSADYRDDLMHQLHDQAWKMWKAVRELPGDHEPEVPDFSVLTYAEMDYLQHWDMPGLPYDAHLELLAEMGRRWTATDPCPTCGHRNPE